MKAPFVRNALIVACLANAFGFAALEALKKLPDSPEATALVKKIEGAREAAARLNALKKEEEARKALRDENARATVDPTAKAAAAKDAAEDPDDVNLPREFQDLQSLKILGKAPLDVTLQEKRGHLGHRILSLSIKAKKDTGPGRFTFKVPEHIKVLKGAMKHELPAMKKGWEKLEWTWEVEITDKAPAPIEVDIEIQGKSSPLTRKASGALLGF
jgi:hypothetical protein